MATSRSSARMRTTFGLRLDSASAALLSQLHKVAQRSSRVHGRSGKQHMLTIY